MKTKLIRCTPLIVLPLFAAALLSNHQQSSRVGVKAYDSSSLPTTIDLNDTSAANIRSYYSSLSNLSTSERQGTNLLKNLKTILKNGQKYYSYDGGSAIWKIYEIANRDWELSPASSTTYGTYNSKTNEITGYTYGTSASSSKNNPYIHALYFNRNITNEVTAWDNHQQDEWGINREHVWPKAEGFDTSGAGGARGDPMHLMAGAGYSNNIHSNYFYGYVDTSLSYTNCGTKYSNQTGNLLGTSKTKGSGSNVFEPQDCDKGDIARAIFYMVARYNYLSGSDSDGIDSNNPNLTLTNELSDWASSGYTSSTSKTGKMGIMTDLLAWHHADPVDEYEIHRNNLLYNNYTNNRNPFIDFPEWVDYIWGTATYSGSTYVSYSSTPTGYATPATDTINGYNDDEDVSVTGVALNKDSTSLTVGDTETLTAYVSPNNATDTAVIWTSSNNSAATVSNGVVTAVAAGEATITVTTHDGGFTDTCTVTVAPNYDASVGSIDAVDGAFSGWTASGLGSAYNDGSAKFDSSGDYVQKTDIFSGNMSKNMISLSVTINAKINGSDSESNSYILEALNSSGTVISSTTYTGLIGGSLTNKTFTISSNLSGCTGFRFKYLTKSSGNLGVKSLSWSASANQEITSITASVNKTYLVGETISKSDITVLDNYGKAVNDFTFASDGYRFTYADATSGGAMTNKNFTVSCNELETTLTVQVARDAYSDVDDVVYELSSVAGDFESVEGTNSASATDNTITKNGISYIAKNSYKYSSYLSFKTSWVAEKTYSCDGSIYNSTRFATSIKSVSYTITNDIPGQIEYNDTLDLENPWPTFNNGRMHYFRITFPGTFYGYINFSSITVTLHGEETATNVANYIMFEDTNNQCTTKFDQANIYFTNMSTSERSTFMTSSDYVMATARERLEAWALNQGKEIVYQNGDYSIVDNSYRLMDKVTFTSDNSKTVLIVIAFVSFVSITLFFVFKKKEKESHE